MANSDASDGRYEIEFSTDRVGLIETLATGGAALAIQAGADAVLGDEHGWYCKITDIVTGLWASQWGATKGAAQEATFYQLREKIAGFEVEQERRQQTEREQEAQQRREVRRPAHLPSTEDSGGSEFIGKLIAYAVVGIAIIWFVFSVAIPLLVINVATIALIATAVRRHWGKVLLPISVMGAALIVVDYNEGWYTRTLVNNVSFFAGLIPAFLYLNIFAGLLAAYLLVRAFMNDRNAPLAGAGEFTRRNVLAMACLFLVGGLTIGLQRMADAGRLNAHQVAGAATAGRPAPSAISTAPVGATASPADGAQATAPTIPGRFPDASTRLLDDAELSGMSKQDLKIMRNEIFARHGYVFKTPEMEAYFAAQPWYHQRSADVTAQLSGIEQRNLALIKRHE